MTQVEVAEKLFLDSKTIASTERRAIEKIRKLLAERNITAQDILGE
jgi:DNA-directed RNA polymerase specialized sigma24 family protein